MTRPRKPNPFNNMNRRKDITLTTKQQKFVNAYISNPDTAHAVRAAGYNTKYPTQMASQLLALPHVRTEIERRRRAMDMTSALTYERKLKMVEEALTETHADKDWQPFVQIIKVANDMQGHNAPKEQVNLNINESIKSVKDARIKYKEY
jgi:phage terminase small subunit